jgi:hypothetical protein
MTSLLAVEDEQKEPKQSGFNLWRASCGIISMAEYWVKSVMLRAFFV